MYLVTRKDLPAGDQAVQGAHAALAFAAQRPGEWSWQGTLVFLAVPSELDLYWLLDRAERDGIAAVPFREPDLGDALTAVALGTDARRLCSRYPLAFGEGVTT